MLQELKETLSLEYIWVAFGPATQNFPETVAASGLEQGMLGNSLVTFRSGGVIYYFLEKKKNREDAGWRGSDTFSPPPFSF